MQEAHTATGLDMVYRLNRCPSKPSAANPTSRVSKTPSLHQFVTLPEPVWQVRKQDERPVTVCMGMKVGARHVKWGTVCGQQHPAAGTPQPTCTVSTERPVPLGWPLRPPVALWQYIARFNT